MLFLALCLTIAILIERFIFALICVAELFIFKNKRSQAVIFVQNTMQFSVTLMATCVASFGSLCKITVRTVLWIVFFILVWGVLYALCKESGLLFFAIQEAYNLYIAGTVRLALLYPLRLVNLLLTYLIPVWNLGVYCVISIPPKVLLENIVMNLTYVEHAVVELAYFMKNFVLSIVSYAQLLIDTPDSFDPSQRLFDFITPMGYLRLIMQYLVQWVAKMCLIATPILDIVTYPFMDVNFAEFVHWGVNSIFFLLIHVPMITVDRCKAGGGLVVYCLPDFEPVYQMLVQSLRSLGMLVDNWSDVVLLILQALLTGTSVTCNGWSAVDFSDRWGVNETVVLGINSNEYVKTDGWSAEIYTRTTVQKLPAVFSMPVRVDYGIASVTTSTTDALFGCVCSDGVYGMEVTCSVAPLDARMSPHIIPVEFRIPTTSFYMSCKRSKIRVESIRWPVNRFTSSVPGTPVVAQAAIWVRPFCSADADEINLACVQTFALASCFPYCMALYTKGLTAASGTLVLRSANEWRSTVYMVDRDCGLFNWNVVGGELKPLTEKLLANSGVINPALGVEVQTSSTDCIYSANTVSRLTRNISASYNQFDSIDLSGQPFGFAGDLVFTAENPTSSTWGVRVSRLYGNQHNEFTIIDLNQFIPALPPCQTPRDCSNVYQSCLDGSGCLISIPYSFDDTPWAHIPATTSKNFAFWVTNPSLNMYETFNLWCQQTDRTVPLGFVPTSSYHGIRIWRFDPYVYCPIDVATGIRKCPDQAFAKYIELPGFITQMDANDCDIEFNVVAPTISYLNEDNIAVTVLWTAFRNVDTDTLRPINESEAR